jgi:hypothetical protein
MASESLEGEGGEFWLVVERAFIVKIKVNLFKN